MTPETQNGSIPGVGRCPVRYASLCVLLILCTTGSNAGVVTSCTELEGYSYFPEGDLVSKKDSGWAKDRITGGRVVVTRTKGEFDIIFTDAAKRTVSSKEDGATIQKLEERPGTLVLLVIYPRVSVETWVFKIDQSGRGYLMMSQQRFGEAVLLRKYALMRADCAK